MILPSKVDKFHKKYQQSRKKNKNLSQIYSVLCALSWFENFPPILFCSMDEIFLFTPKILFSKLFLNALNKKQINW